MELTDDIDAWLEYFQELEHATRMLNHPGGSLVLRTDFLYMVEWVDICIDYLETHVSIPPFFLHVIMGTCYAARLSRSRNIPIPISAVHDPCHDTHQRVFRGLSLRPVCGRFETTLRKGKPFGFRATELTDTI